MAETRRQTTSHTYWNFPKDFNREPLPGAPATFLKVAKQKSNPLSLSGVTLGMESVHRVNRNQSTQSALGRTRPDGGGHRLSPGAEDYGTGSVAGADWEAGSPESPQQLSVDFRAMIKKEDPSPELSTCTWLCAG